MIQSWAKRVGDCLQTRYLPWYLAALAMVLSAASLWLGWQFDDEFHRAALTMPELTSISRTPAELFVFIEGDKVANRWAMKLGMLPWWSHEGLRLAFFRPLTGLTHWLDYKLWPQFPSLMHLHSLVWFGGVVIVATFFYRRMLGVTWVAGLAALLFAVDDAHGLPAAWIANRNALIGVFFGLLALIAHDRWRRDGWWIGAVLAPLALLLGLLSKESTAAIGAYLLAYALFLDRGTWMTRGCSLIPCALTGLLWWVAYKEYGYGTVGSGWYLDPSADPVQFAEAVTARAPLLLSWQWLIPSDLEWTLSDTTAHVMRLAAMGGLVLIAVMLAPLLRRDALARFWALGMILSVLPACAVYPMDRLLFFVGIGGMGLLAQFVAAVFQKVNWPSMGALWYLPARALCTFLIVIHLGLAPIAFARTSERFKTNGRFLVRAAASLPSDTTARFQTVVIVNSPTFATYSYSTLMRLMYGDPYLSRTLVLASGSHPIRIHRQDERTLLVRPEGGFLATPCNSQPGGELPQVLFDQRSAYWTLDQLYRDNSPMTIGQRISLIGVTVEVTALTDDGRPAEAAFHFLTKLENPLFRWLHWNHDAYAPFNLPAVGETLTLPPIKISYEETQP